MFPSEYATQPFWDVPARLSHGDQLANTIYRAVGEALSRWERLEEILNDLFAVLVEATSPAAARAYGALASATGRGDALDRAAEIYFSRHTPEKEPLYRTIRNAVRYAAARRNDIAHGMAIRYAWESVAGGGYFLVPPSYNTRRINPFLDFEQATNDPFSFTGHKYAYTSAQVEEFARRFGVMAPAVENFARDLLRSARRERQQATCDQSSPQSS